MTTPIVVSRMVQTVKAHSPELLTAFGVVGTATTAYLTGKATVTAVRVIDEEEARTGVADDRKQRIKERVGLVWKLYIPPAASGITTIACIVGLQRVSSRRTAAAVTAYAVAERGLSEYREKVEEQLGKTKEQKFQDAIAQDKVDATPPSAEMMIIHTGRPLFCELFTMRYLRCDMETLKQAERKVNDEAGRDIYVTLTEFYDMIGLPQTSQSDDLGWDASRPLELRISTAHGPGDEPCTTFDYNYIKPV